MTLVADAKPQTTHHPMKTLSHLLAAAMLTITCSSCSSPVTPYGPDIVIGPLPWPAPAHGLSPDRVRDAGLSLHRVPASALRTGTRVGGPSRSALRSPATARLPWAPEPLPSGSIIPRFGL